MTKEEQEKFQFLIELISKVEEFKYIIVKSKEFQLAGSLRDFEKGVHQCLSDFFNTRKSYTENDLQKAFYAGRSGISTSSEHDNMLKSDSSYPTFESWLQTITY